MSVQTYDLGTVLMVPKGDWNSTTAYERLNLVRHNGTAWLCTVAAGQTSVGEEPSSSATNWEILVQDQSSVTSVNGQRGDVVIDESGLVHKAGTEAITGDKTFSGSNTFSGENSFTGTTSFGANTKGVTATAGDNSTKLATTAFVQAAKPSVPSASSSTPAARSTSGSVGSSTAYARADHSHPKNWGTSSVSQTAPAVVVETWHSGTEWYRVWSDGWIEQGGAKNTSTTTNLEIVFNKAFTVSPKYLNFVVPYLSAANANNAYKSFSPTGATLYVNVNSNTLIIYWYACGY